MNLFHTGSKCSGFRNVCEKIGRLTFYQPISSPTYYNRDVKQSNIESVNFIQQLKTSFNRDSNTNPGFRHCVSRKDVSIIGKYVSSMSRYVSHTHSVKNMTQIRCYCKVVSGGEDGIDDEDEDDMYDEDQDNSGVDVLNEEFNSSVKQYCHLLDGGHKVFVLQIYDRFTSLSSMETPRNSQTVNYDLEENIALIEAIPKWTVAGSMVLKVKNTNSLRRINAAFENATETINSVPGVSAVFVTINRLTSPVLVIAQHKWKVPVYDRSFIITQVFKSHAVTREAKIHVALAELPYLRFCFMHRSSFKFNKEMPRPGATLPFKDHEKKLKTALIAWKKQRTMVRSRRTFRQIPTIAVIGYTNSGKTTLIKALTGDKDLTPRNRLFATLDVTAHSGLLPNHMMVVYMDTVGFISDLPVNMKPAFTATLEDTISADVVLHVRDISHPDTEEQKSQVLQSVSKLLTPDKLNTMIEVCNKVDCIDGSVNIDDVLGDDMFPISAVTGEGMDVLLPEIQTRLLKNIDVCQKRMKIPLNGLHLSWLHKEATVVSTDVTDDPESVVVHVYITETNYRRFLARFRTKKYAYAR